MAAHRACYRICDGLFVLDGGRVYADVAGEDLVHARAGCKGQPMLSQHRYLGQDEQCGQLSTADETFEQNCPTLSRTLWEIILNQENFFAAPRYITVTFITLV